MNFLSRKENTNEDRFIYELYTIQCDKFHGIEGENSFKIKNFSFFGKTTNK